MTSIDTLISKQERKLDLEIEILEAQLAEMRAKRKLEETRVL
jgi:hypothetical protein